MSDQLRGDIAKAFSAACDRIQSHRLEDPDLVQDVTRWMDAAARFIEPSTLIREARHAAILQVERAVRIIEQAGRGNLQSVQTARSYAVEALSRLEAAILIHGRINDAGDRVGLGCQGDRL